MTPPKQAGHTTYRLAQEPAIGTLWTYADRQDDGSFKRVGGGDLRRRAPTPTARARSTPTTWPARPSSTCATGSRPAPPRAATRRTRCCAASPTCRPRPGPNAGNVVLWMQPDGTLNPSAEPGRAAGPVGQRRVVLAGPHHLGAGGGVRRLRAAPTPPSRGSSSSGSTSRSARSTGRCSTRTGSTCNIDGRRTPAWLIVDGADASAEAVLGLAAYVRAGGTVEARRVLRQLTDGIAEMAGGDARQLAVRRRAAVGTVAVATGTPGPRRCRRPWPSASDASATGRWAAAADRDSFTFDPWLLTSGGPDNGRLPDPARRAPRSPTASTPACSR